MQNISKCPICGSSDYRYVRYIEEMGIVEQHGRCNRCGYRIEQAYSYPIEGYDYSTRRGYKDRYGTYHAKNVRKRKRMKHKYGISYDDKIRTALAYT